MAGDWIKFEKTTPDKPEVFEISGMLSIDPDAVVGKLLRVWNWFDDHSKDGHAHVTVMSLLDRYAGVTGFMSAMQKVGWVIVDGDNMILPNFSRHNGEPAKVRALAKNRKQNQRGKCHADSHADSHAPAVTKSGPEKRREEKSITTPISPSLDLELLQEETIKPDPDRIAVGRLLGRRESTRWSPEEVKLLKAVKPIHPDDLAMMSEFYNAEIPKELDYRRTTIERLLKNWTGELDKARVFKNTNQ